MSRVTPAIARAAELAAAMCWQTRVIKIGYPGAIPSSWARVGIFFPGNRSWFQPQPSTSCPGGSRRSRIKARRTAPSSSTEEAPERSATSIPRPTSPRWRWLSPSPGSSGSPPRPMTRVAGVASSSSSSPPTAAVTPSFTATAVAQGRAASPVHILALWMIRSMGGPPYLCLK